MPAMITGQEGSASRTPLRSGMVATTIQSTTASRPILAARNWLTRVEKVLEIKPRSAAARQFRIRLDHQEIVILPPDVGRPEAKRGSSRVDPVNCIVAELREGLCG